MVEERISTTRAAVVRMLDTQTDKVDVYDKAVSKATDKMGCVCMKVGRQRGRREAERKVVIQSAGGAGEGEGEGERERDGERKRDFRHESAIVVCMDRMCAVSRKARSTYTSACVKQCVRGGYCCVLMLLGTKDAVGGGGRSGTDKPIDVALYHCVGKGLIWVLNPVGRGS